MPAGSDRLNNCSRWHIGKYHCLHRIVYGSINLKKKIMKPSFAQRNAHAEYWGRNPKKKLLVQPYGKSLTAPCQSLCLYSTRTYPIFQIWLNEICYSVHFPLPFPPFLRQYCTWNQLHCWFSLSQNLVLWLCSTWLMILWNHRFELLQPVHNCLMSPSASYDLTASVAFFSPHLTETGGRSATPTLFDNQK